MKLKAYYRRPTRIGGQTPIGISVPRKGLPVVAANLVVRGRLWRCTDPRLDDETRTRLTHELMDARRAKGAALKSGDAHAVEQAKSEVQQAKVGLGERGPVWWDDGEPDLTRHLARTTPYAEWFESQDQG